MDGHKPPFVKVAWAFIILFVVGIAFLQTIPMDSGNGGEEDSAGLVIVQLQAEYLLGAATLLDADRDIATQSGMLDMGSVGQRQRYMAFMIALGATDVAQQSSLSMQTKLQERGKVLTEQQANTQEMLDILACGGELQSGHTPLVDSLGWFGTLVEANESERELIASTAATKVLIVGSMFLFICIAAMAGFVGLIIYIVRAFGGSMKSALTPPSSHHGVYAEVFALWLISFLVLMVIAAATGQLLAKDNSIVAMLFSLLAFFSSLLVLLWARVRGVSLKQLRDDIGWHMGNGFFKELCCGVAGYAMMLPLLGIGVLLTLLLMGIQVFFAGGSEADPFGGTSGGAHPIIVEIASGGWQLRILLIVLAAVAAPIVEETMFRGVLYRQLRTSSRKLGQACSILASVFFVSFLFAAIHPQGWIAIPALMGIAVGMNLVREWRGSIIPSMVVHGLSNGVVTTMMIVFLS